MTILEPDVSRDVIDASVRDARHPGHDPARWALPLIAAADRMAKGAWSLAALDLDEALALWLPPHAGEPCHGDTLMLGRQTPQPGADKASAWEGLALGDAASWLGMHAQPYAAANPSCWQRISTARDTTWGPLVVARFSVGDRTGPAGRLVVVDGLHRALGWALRTRDSRGDGAAGSALLAYVAGPTLDAVR